MAVSQYVLEALQNLELAFSITRLNPQWQSTLIQMILTELDKEDLSAGALHRQSAVNRLDPYRMPPREMGALIAWTCSHYPQVLGRIAITYHEQPEALEGLLGERLVKAIAENLTGSPERDRIPRGNE